MIIIYVIILTIIIDYAIAISKKRLCRYSCIYRSGFIITVFLICVHTGLSQIKSELLRPAGVSGPGSHDLHQQPGASSVPLSLVVYQRRFYCFRLVYLYQ